MNVNAVLFIPLLALTWAVGFVLALVAAHWFLAVIDSTAAGSEKIVWPDEPVADWFWKLFYLTWLVAAWMGPIVIFSRLAIPNPWLRLAFTIGGFWLCFPIGMMSSLSATSPWLPFWPGLLKRMSQRPGNVILFYLVSIPISIALVGSMRAIMMRPETSSMQAVLLAPVAAAGFLVYARALGRLSLVLTFTKGGENERVKRKRKPKKEAPSQQGEHDEQPRRLQPSELPPLETLYDGPITGYDVVYDDKAPIAQAPPPRHRIVDDEDLEPIPVEAALPDAAGAKQSPKLPPPMPSELALFDKSQRVKEPKHPFNAGLVTFLGESRTSTAWLVLSGGLALLGLMIQLMRELRPE